MRAEDFNFISQLLKERSGLVLSEDKSYLLESRLMPIARQNNFKSLEELIVALRGKDQRLLKAVTEAMTTNESFFFRDGKPFDQFRNIVLPAMLQKRAGTKKIRIWCAAASSGQEPYSLAMILRDEAAKLQGWTVEIIGTDLSSEILDKARSGRYSQFEVQRGLPVQLLVKNFEKDGDAWVLKPDVRKMVQYREFNLLDEYKGLGQFDIVFCRNVLIYFDQPTKGKVLNKIAALMPKDGYLFLGGAETVLGLTEAFKPLQGERGVYTLGASGAPVSQPTSLLGTPGQAATSPTLAKTSLPSTATTTKPPMAGNVPGGSGSSLQAVRPALSGTTSSPLGQVKQPQVKPLAQMPRPGVQPATPAATTTARPAARSATPAATTTARPAARPATPAATTTVRPATHPATPAATTTARPATQPATPAATTTARPATQPATPAATVRPATQLATPAATTSSSPTSAASTPSAIKKTTQPRPAAPPTKPS